MSKKKGLVEFIVLLFCGCYGFSGFWNGVFVGFICLDTACRSFVNQ